MRNQITVYCLLLSAVLAQAKLADHFPMIGNERHVVKDQLSGKDIIFLTDAKYMNSTQYPHNKAFIEDDKYVIFESSRLRPDGSGTAGTFPAYQNGERQLLAADIESGDIYHLASLEFEDTAKYGQYHVHTSSQYHSDYAPATNTVVYYDMTGHNLYMLNLNTGLRKQIWHTDYGTLGDPPSITEDGTRLIVYVVHSGVENPDFFANRITSVYYFDIDAVTNEVSKPKLITVWVHRKVELDAVNTSGIYLAHPLVNPANRDEFSFCHGFNGYSNGTIDCARIWYGKVDGSLIQMANPTPEGHIFTHELWGPQGRLIYYVDIVTTGGISSVDPRTGEVVKLIEGTKPRCLHISVSGDEKRIVFDTQDYTPENPLDQYKNHLENIVLFDVPAKQTTILARQTEGQGHPRQMHPIINRKGNKVCFTVTDGPTSKVAVIKID